MRSNYPRLKRNFHRPVRCLRTGYIFLLWLICILVLQPSTASAQRNRVLIDSGWKFSLDSAINSAIDPTAIGFDDSNWRTVNLPHDYVIEQPFTPGLDPQHASLPTPSAWYRKTVLIPKSDIGKDVWLDFDGIFRDARIYVNGKLMVEHQSGYVPAHVDLSAIAEAGKQLAIAVHVDPSKFEGWWYEGGGIYRHVWLTTVDRVHIDPYGVYVNPTVIGDVAQPHTANINISVTLTSNSPKTNRFSVEQRIYGPSGTLAASQTTGSDELVAPGAAKISTATIQLPHPLLWSIEKPNLYRLESTLYVGNSNVDQVETTFGIRTIHFDPNGGFFLNGKSVKIRGFCNHQDFAGIGIAVPDNLKYWAVRKMMDLGANAWRTAHNPPSPALLDACDQYGVLVLDENRHLGDTYGPKLTASDTETDDYSDLETMIRRDRNHPCIVAWSLCNEEPLQGTTDGARILKKMIIEVKKLDTTRLVTTAMNGGWGSGFSQVEDLQGCNYLVASYAKFHKDFPLQPMIFTESTSAVADRGIYDNNWSQGYLGSYTEADPNDWVNWVKTTEDRWVPIAENNYLAGDFVWAGFDYKGEPNPTSWPDINSHYGVLDMCGFPKDDAYYYMAYWGNKPIVHITPNWNLAGSEGKPITVIVFSNAPKVDLNLNGVDLGAKDCPFNGHAQWTVDYQPGTLTAKGYDANGNLLKTVQNVTAGVPNSIALRTDIPVLTANGEDESVIEASLLDANGNIVARANNLVTFTISGKGGQIVGSGNGDPVDHTPDESSVRHAFSGRLAAIVRSTSRRGTVVVSATSPGILPGSISIQFK